MGTPDLKAPARSPAWSVYVLRCRDGSLYTGIATDVERRIAEHERGPKGSKYLRGRGPFTLVFQAAAGDRAHATRAELAIKRLPKAAKERLVGVGPSHAAEIIQELTKPAIFGAKTARLNAIFAQNKTTFI